MTDTYISDEMVEAYKAAFMEALQKNIDSPCEDGQHASKYATRAALEAIAPDLIRKGMEMAAELIDKRIPMISQEQAAAFSRGDDRLGYQIYARHCEAATIASAIRTAKEEV